MERRHAERLNLFTFKLLELPVKTFRNYLIANFCALVPLWYVAFGWMPDQVRIYMRGQEAPGAISANGTGILGEYYDDWRGGREFRFYLRAEMEWKDLVFHFPGASGAGGVERVELQKWKVLSLGKAGSGLVKSGQGAHEYVFMNPRFDSVGFARGKVIWVFAALEVLLAILSWWSARRCHVESWKDLLPPTLALTLALTLLTQVALPVQSYWANRASYPYSSGELMEAIAWRFAWTSVLGIAAVASLARWFGRRVFDCIFSLAVCIYLEAGILSKGLATLNGDVFLLQNRTRALWDAAVWAAVFATVALAHSHLRNRYVLASLCLGAMVGASMFDTRHEKLADQRKLIVHDFVPFDRVIHSVVYSTNRNVMVFVVDSLEREQAHAIMEDSEAGPKLREQFRGFTEYTNNVGALPQTLVAIPNLLTGRYPDGTSSMADYSWSCYGPESVLADFLAMGGDVFMTTPGLGCGYTTRTNEMSVQMKDRGSVLERPGNGGEAWSIRDFTRWRCLPFVAKATFSELMGIAHNAEDFKEWGVYPELEKARIEPCSSGTFLWVHTEGVHVPIALNRRGEMLPTEDHSDRGCVELGVFIMGKLGDLMDSYRESGLYDQSTILVLGDHGGHKERKYIQDKKAGRLPGNARPALWVKPAGSTHDFQTCALPTSHAKIADLLRASAREDISEEDIASFLSCDKRIYRRIALLGGDWTDWVVKADGSFAVETHQNTFSTQDKQHPLQCGHSYSLNWRKLKTLDVDCTFRGAGIAGFPFLHRDNHKMSIEFRVPDAEKRYALRLELHDAEIGTLRFRCDVSGADWKEFPIRPHGIIVVEGVTADSTGMARILCERAAGPAADVAFASLTLFED